MLFKIKDAEVKLLLAWQKTKDTVQAGFNKLAETSYLLFKDEDVLLVIALSFFAGAVAAVLFTYAG